MPSFADSAVIFILALLLFGPKKLPVLARELGKWIGEFRRASNEFKMQMEEELRMSEQADRQKELAAIEAAAPVAPALEGIPTEDPEHPHTDRYDHPYEPSAEALNETTLYPDAEITEAPAETAPEPPAPLPIATSGDLSIMPPSTGLPIPQTRAAHTSNDLGSFIDSIPAADPPRATEHHTEHSAETATHG